jgi:cell wall assembly regulator SMI1
VRHQVAKYLPLADSEDTLFGVEPKSCVSHISECFGEVGQVILFVFACDDNVVHVGENIAAYLTFADPLCEAGEG